MMSKGIKKSARWITIGACATFFAVFALVSARWDLQISQALYNPNSLYGQFFEKLGELPNYLTPLLVGTVLFHNDFGKSPVWRIVWKTLSASILFGGFYFAFGTWFWGHFARADIPFAIVYKLFFSALLTLCCLLATARADKEVMRRLLAFVIFTVIVVALGNIIVQIFKAIWVRQRFRTMVDNEQNAATILAYGRDFIGFTPWYRPNGVFPNPIRTESYMAAFKAIDGSSFSSFPSAHTVGAAASFSIILLPDMFARLEKYRWMFWVFPAAYTILVAISRIVAGAHYLSDVLFGGFAGFCMAVFIRFILLRKFPSFIGATSTAEGKTLLRR